VSLLEAIIIYLSAGAPFGVLVFFSQRSTARIRIVYALLATFAWPIVGGNRLYRSFWRRADRNDTFHEAEPLEVLQSLIDEVPVEPAELFEIAGHPNPWLATSCYTRSRKRVIRSHIDRLEMATEPVLEENDLGTTRKFSTLAPSSIRS
jgi:hypothetical protein